MWLELLCEALDLVQDQKRKEGECVTDAKLGYKNDILWKVAL